MEVPSDLALRVTALIVSNEEMDDIMKKVSNEEMDDIIKRVKSQEATDLLMKGASKIIKNEAKDQKDELFSMLVGTLGGQDRPTFKVVYSRNDLLKIKDRVYNKS